MIFTTPIETTCAQCGMEFLTYGFKTCKACAKKNIQKLEDEWYENMKDPEYNKKWNKMYDMNKHLFERNN